MKGINDLPIYDLWPIIFSNLSIQDLFNCRLVSKKFKEFSDNTNGIIRLIVGQPNVFRDKDFHWYYNNKLIEDNEIISSECFKQIRSLSIFNLDRNLKYLKIYDQQFNFEELSSLINLESLEFGENLKKDNQQIINLSNLKVIVSNNNSVQLNTPKLEMIQFEKFNSIKLNINPESIKHLITRDYDYKLEIFKNLQIIELRNTLLTVDENLLITFKNLKQLKINFNYYFKYLERLIKNGLIRILNKRIELEKKIDIYLEGVKIENIDKFNEAHASDEWIFKMNNYDLLDLNLPFVNSLDYERLEKCVDNIRNNLPSSFFDKFQNIELIYLGNVNDYNSLNWFLSNLKYLRKIVINPGASVNELSFNILSNKIIKLYISNRDINYDFIFKLPKLVQIYAFIDADLFDLAFAAFSNLKNLSFFLLRFKNEWIKIKKKDNKFYLDDKELDFNQLKEECNKIKQNLNSIVNPIVNLIDVVW